MLAKSLTISRKELEQALGWELKDRQACKGDICIPLGFEVSDDIDIELLSRDMGLPLVREPEFGLYALGPEAIGQRALTTAECPDICLPDLNGHEFRLKDLRGQKVLLYAWAPY